MPETVTLWLTDAEMTVHAGASLAQTLHRLPLTLWLTGELGSGKTTFLQGFSRSLGIPRRVLSPTFALEQRYGTPSFGELLHVDLYRLDAASARSLVESSDDHAGIRCIEWADRLSPPLPREGIHITLTEERNRPGRLLTVMFADIALPSFEEITRWREEVWLSETIARHCDAVAAMAVRLGEALLRRGELIRPEALRAAGRLHDHLRFVNFRPGAGHIEEGIRPERACAWEGTRQKYAGLNHEAASAAFLAERGYPEVGEIVRTHGLSLASSNRVTIEQQLLYYADKRVKLDEVVSLEERLLDFTARYSKDGKLLESDAWYEEARRTERELFPEGPPV